jgi:hypothetical protein
MDEHIFDSIVRSLGDGATRRRLVSLLGGGLTGGALLSLAGEDAEGGKKKGKKKKKPCPPCKKRKNGKCKPDPGKAGQPCSGCRVCGANGSCGVPSDDRCADGQLCRPSTGICCPVCVNDGCCGVAEACINPGLLSANFCCDTRANTPCGGKGNGTFTECCSNLTEECCGDTCVPRGTCSNHCANNTVYTEPCVEGADKWCCRPSYSVCCRDSDGDPHCCNA